MRSSVSRASSLIQNESLEDSFAVNANHLAVQGNGPDGCVAADLINNIAGTIVNPDFEVVEERIFDGPRPQGFGGGW